MSICLLESELELVSSVAESNEFEICSEQGSIEWESPTEAIQDGESEANDQELLKYFNFLPREGQPQEQNGETDPFELAREIINGYERRNIVFKDSELPAPEKQLWPLVITVEVNGYLLPGILVDTGASRSACSLNTLDYLDVGEEEITKEKIFF